MFLGAAVSCNNWAFISSLAALTLAGLIVSANAQGTKTPASSPEIDTEHIFGFVEGSDIGQKGDLEGEIQNTSAIGKRSGSYFASSNQAQLKYTISDNFRIAPSLNFSYHNINNVPDVDNRNQFAFAGAGMEMRYHLLNWRTAPFGLTLSATPTWARSDQATGDPVEQFGLVLAALLDKELIKDRVLAAFNVFYEPRWTRVTAIDTSEQTATFSIGGAVSAQIMPGIFLGGELLYERAYLSAGLANFAGQAMFLGPTAYFAFTDRASLSIAWNVQIAGKAIGDPSALDLTNFERNQVRARFSLDF